MSGFSNPSKAELLLLNAFEEGVLIFPYRAMAGFLKREETRNALISLEKRGWIVIGSTCRLTKKGRDAQRDANTDRS